MPSDRNSLPISYDPNSNRLILFGGLNHFVDRGTYDDSWVLTHANGLGGAPEWVKLDTSGPLPAARRAYVSAYDPKTNRLVAALGEFIVLGTTTTSTTLDDAWVLGNASGYCTAGQPCTFKVTATDPDVSDALRYSSDAAPPGMVIDPATGAVAWTPSPAEIGNHAVTVRVTDRGGLFATLTFTASVAPVAVPNVVGLAPEWAESFITAADLAVGTKTSKGGAVTLNFDSLPSRQGWVYHALNNTAPEGRVYSVAGGVLLQDSIGVGFQVSGANRYVFDAFVDPRMPYDLSLRVRAIREEGGGTCPGFQAYVEDSGATRRVESILGIRTEAILGGGCALVAPLGGTAFHQYQLRRIPHVGSQLVVDGIVVGMSTPVVRPPGPPFPGLSYSIGFGDSTGAQNGQVELTALGFRQPLIVGQNPPAGTLVPNKTTVDLTIVDGPATETVPNVIGLSQAAAEAAIVTANLKPGGVTSAPHPTIPAGQVSDQSPLPNIHVPKDTPVAIVMSTGPPAPVNVAPIITSAPVLTATAGQPYGYQVTATDPDTGDVLTYSLATAPTGMTINAATGLIAWTPGDSQVGNQNVTVRVTDKGGLFVAQTFAVTVAAAPPVNHAPVAVDDAFLVGQESAGSIRAISLAFDRLPSAQGWTFATNNARQGITESQIFSLCAPDGTPALCLDSTKVPYDSSDGSAFWYIRRDADLSQPHTIVVRARMLEERFEGSPSGRNAQGVLFGAYGIAKVSAFGIGINPPRIQSYANGREEMLVTFDPTQWHDYRMEVTPTVGFQLFVDGATTPLVSGPGTPDSSGPFLYFGDGTSFNAVRAEISRYTFIAQPTLAGNVLGNDSDPDGDPLTARLISTPAHGTVDLKPRGDLVYVPEPGFVGIDTFQYRANDGRVDSNPATVTLSVVPPNHPPIITSTAILSATAGQPYAYTVTATDPDAGDALTFSLPTAPAGMTINSTTGLITWTPTLAEVGNHKVTVRVADAGGLFAEQSFTISVAALPSANRPPVITSVAVTTAVTGKPYVYDVEAIDPDADPVSFKLLVAQDCLPPPPDMVGWWSGDGTTRDIANGNNGEARLGATYGPGMVGKAFKFDGIDDYVYVPYSPVFHFGEKQDFTLDAWINLQNPIPGRDDEIVITGDHQQLRVDPSKTFYRFFVSLDTRTLHLRMGNTNFNHFLVSDQSIPLNRWTHVAAVRRGATASLYINGELNTSTVMTDGPLTNGGPLSIGGIYDTAQTDSVEKYNVFGGLIDELEIHRRALSAGEIRAVYQAGNLGKCKEPRGLPEGMTFDPGTGLIQWTPSLLQAGRYYVSVEANDGRGGKDVQPFVIEASAPPNRPPVITSEPVRDAKVGVPYQYDVEATDPDGDALTHRLTSGDFKGLQGIATGASGDIYVVDDRAFSGLGSVFRVDPVSGGQTVVASGGELVGPRGIAVDAGGKLLVVDPFAVAGAGAVIRIDPATGGQAIVSSGGHFVLPSGIAIAGDGMLYVADADALGGPGAIIRVHPTSGEQTVVASGGNFAHPVGVAIDTTGRLFVLDRHAFSSGPNDIGGGVIAVDTVTGAQTKITSGGSFSSRTGSSIVSVAPDKLAVSAFSFRSGSVVFSVNPDSKVQALIAQAGNLVLPTGLALEPGGNIVAADFMAFGTGGVLRINPATGNQAIVSPAIVEGMTIDSGTGLIRWTPVAGQVGDHPVTVRVEDGNGGVAMQAYSVRVASGGPSNAPPVVTSTAITAATADQAYAYPVTATDPNPGDTLTFSLPTAPSGMTINPTTGLIGWTPTLAQVGDHNATVRVTDGGGLFAEQSFSINVAPENRKPTAIGEAFGMLRAIPFLPPFWSKNGTITLRGEDPDGDPLTYELVDRPIHGDLKGTPPSLTYVPNACFAGTDRLTFRVRDGKLDSEVATVDIYVGEDCNRNGVADPLDIARGTSQDCNGNGVPDECEVAIKGRGFTNLASWSAYDPGEHGVGKDPDGYAGGAYDGRYVYFAPYFNGSDYSGEVLRYDTRAEFETPEAWKAFDLPTNGVGKDARGFSGAVFDGRYVYFVPGQSSHGEIARFDTQGEFAENSAWTVYSPQQAGVVGISKGYLRAVFDGRYVYFVPNVTPGGAVSARGEVLRLDTTAAFATPQAWSAFDPGDHGVGTDPDGFGGAVFDGRYIYLVPLDAVGGGAGYNGEVIRYDTQTDF